MLARHLHPQFHGAFLWNKGQWDHTVLTQKFPGASPGALGVPVAARNWKTWNETMEVATDSMGPLHLLEQQEMFKGSFTVKEETPPWI